MLEAALQYAADGWHVFPLVTGGKTPATTHGLKDATTDVDIIEQWWTATPHANIGCACGPSNLFVIDIDVKDDANGYKPWFELCDCHGDKVEPATRVHTTPSGGEHRLYVGAGKNTASKLAPLIDTRGDGGYIVLPPSEINGIRYTVDAAVEPQPVPQWVVDRLASKSIKVAGPRAARAPGSYGQAALDGEIVKLIRCPEGQRNHTLNVAAFSLGQLCAGGVLEMSTVMSELSFVASRVGLPEDEAARTIRSGLLAGGQNPRTP